MALTLPTYLYCTQGDVEAVLSSEGLSLRLDDENPTGAPTATELGYLNNRIIPWSTAWANMYLLGRYDASDLAQSFVVNDFTALKSSIRACQRRGNPAPENLVELLKETMELLKDIKANRMALEDVPERVSGSISWRNIHHSRHVLRRNRVQRPISEQTPSKTPLNLDFQAEYVGAELYWL